jgi:predicted ATPase
VLEDLHWSDYSTLDLIAYLARRRDRARLMVIGTYRPVDVILGDHPLKGVKRELQAHGLCHELPLEYLTEASVAKYLAVKCPGQMPRLLARLIHRRTEGNPLFMVNLVDYLIDEHVVVPVDGEWRLRGGLAEIESGVPENVKQLIEKQIERLSPEERTVLEGASVVGMECSSVAIGAGLDRPTDWVEERCEALVQRHQFLSAARLVELPDGTVTPRYKFTHVLYLDVPYRRLPAMRRAQIHVRIGHSGEAVYGDRVSEIATELAMHFEQGRDHPRAVKYLLMAAENAVRRSAHHEAEALARRGLQALETLPPAEERDRQELSLRRILGISLMAIKGFAAADVEAVFERALVLCARLGASSEAFMVEWLLGLFHYFRAELVPSRAIVERLLKRAETVDERLIVIEARRASGVTLLELGRFTDSLDDFDAVTDLYDADRQRSQISFAGQDPKVVAECFAARALWTLGYPSQALARLELGLLLGHQLSHVESLVVATHCAAHLHQLRGEPALAQERAETVIGLAEEYGLAVWIAFGHMNRGWARIAQGDLENGLEELERGLTEYDDSGARLWRPHYVGLLAQGLARADRAGEALTNVDAALTLVDHTGESWCAAELHRVRGELLIAQASGETGPGLSKSTPTKLPASVATDVERCFREALAIARQQHARSWELRAVTSLARFHRRQDRRRDGGPILQATYDWFTEGHETADLAAARAVLGGVRS